MIEALRRLTAHLCWADMRTAVALQSVEAPEAERQLGHVIATELRWLARLKGREPEAVLWPEWSLAQTMQEAQRAHTELSEYVAARTSADLHAVLEYRSSSGEPFAAQRADVLLHVMLHGAYHRGQAAAALRAAGGTPLTTDYIAFARASSAPPVASPSTVAFPDARER